MSDLPICLARGCISHISSAIDDTKWCSYHEMLQGKHMKLYKGLTARIHLLDTADLPSRRVIYCCCDTPLLRSWHTTAREKWTLTSRAWLARMYHRNVFYDGGDKNHTIFLQSLKEDMDELEKVIEACDARLYDLLTLEFSWLKEAKELADVDAQGQTHDHRPQDGLSSSKREDQTANHSQPPSAELSTIPAVNDPDSDEEEDPYTTRRNQLMAQILRSWGAQARVQACKGAPVEPSDKFAQRIEIADNLFRGIIVRTPCLLVRARARDFPDMETFVHEGNLSVDELAKLVKKGRKFATKTVRNAIADVFRDPLLETTEEGKIKILGGWHYHRPSEHVLPPRAWEFLHEFIPCTGCILSICRDFAEYKHFRRLSVFGAKYGHWTDIQVPRGLQFAYNYLRLMGVYMCYDNADPSRFRIIQKSSRDIKDMKEELIYRPCCYFKLDRHDTHSLPFIQALRASPAFSVVAQDATTLEYVGGTSLFPDNIWMVCSREGRTPLTLATASWCRRQWNGRALDWLRPESPELRRRTKCFSDVYEVCVMDVEGVQSFGRFYQRAKASDIDGNLIAGAGHRSSFVTDVPPGTRWDPRYNASGTGTPYQEFLGRILQTLNSSRGFTSFEEASRAIVAKAIEDGELEEREAVDYGLKPLLPNMRSLAVSTLGGKSEFWKHPTSSKVGESQDGVISVQKKKKKTRKQNGRTPATGGEIMC